MILLCAPWQALYAPESVSDKLYFILEFPNGYCLRVSCDHNKNHKGQSSFNTGLEKEEVCGKPTAAQVSDPEYF